MVKIFFSWDYIWLHQTTGKHITNINIVEVNRVNATDSFNFKANLTGDTGNNGRIDGGK